MLSQPHVVAEDLKAGSRTPRKLLELGLCMMMEATNQCELVGRIMVSFHKTSRRRRQLCLAFSNENFVCNMTEWLT